MDSCLQLFISFLAPFQTPSPKTENKFPALLTCIDFPSLLHLTSQLSTLVGAVIKTPCLGWAWWELRAATG